MNRDLNRDWTKWLSGGRVLQLEGTAGAKALRQGCAGRFQEQEEAGVLGAAPEVKCGSGR